MIDRLAALALLLGALALLAVAVGIDAVRGTREEREANDER